MNFYILITDPESVTDICLKFVQLINRPIFLGGFFKPGHLVLICLLLCALVLKILFIFVNDNQCFTLQSECSGSFFILKTIFLFMVL